MDFLKLFNLCRTKQLYFASASSLRQQDPFEGSYTLHHAKHQLLSTVGGEPSLTWMTERDTPPPGLDAAIWRHIQEGDLDVRRNLGRHMFINSWHMNENESLAMWKLYDAAGYGVAVVSSFERLRDGLAGSVKRLHMGCVTYIDYQTELKWLGNYYDPFMHKHRVFAHEKEVRAVFWDNGRWVAYWDRLQEDVAARSGLRIEPVNFGEGSQEALAELLNGPVTDPPSGIRIDCDLDRVIDHIVVSPTAQEWMFEEIREYCRNAVGKQVILSEFRSGPFF